MRGFRVLVCLLASIGLSGCWVQRAFDAGRGAWNPFELRLTSRTVDRLAVVWDTEIDAGHPVRSPVAVGDRIAATADGVAAGLDVRTGARSWRQELTGSVSPDVSLSPPTYIDGWLFIPWSCCRPDVAGWFWLRLGNGEMGEGPEIGPPVFPTVTDAAVANGLLATSSVHNSFPEPPAPGTVGIDWTHNVLAFPSDEAQPARVFAIVDDAIQWTYGTFAQSFGPECLPSTDPRFTCVPDWRTDLGALPTAPAGMDHHSVVYGDDSGTVTVLDVASGRDIWRAELGVPVTAGPVVARGMILVATNDDRLVALRAAGCGSAVCSPAWQAHLDGTSTALAAGGDVIYSATGGTLSAFAIDGCRSHTCPALTTVNAGAAISGGPVIHRGRVLVGTTDGRLIAFGLPASP